MKHIQAFESFLNEAAEKMITVSLSSTAVQSFKKDLDGNRISYTQEKPTVFRLEDTPKTRMAIKMAKERFGMQSVLVKESLLDEASTYSSSEMNSNIGDVWTKFVKGPKNMGIYSDVYNWLKSIKSSGNYTDKEIDTAMDLIVSAIDRYKKEK